MNSQFILESLVAKDYNNIVDHIYGDIANLLSNLERRWDYSHKIRRDSIDTLVSFMGSCNPYDAIFLEITRELVIYLSRVYSKLRLDNYNVIRVDDKWKTRLMILYIIFYNYDGRSLSLTKKKLYTGADFEFNERRIALCQLGFYPSRKNKFIWVFDPNYLDSVETKYVIEYNFTTKYLEKIVHGSDSLDVPYLFQDLFMNNQTYIYDFTSRVSDTRFLCEYFKNSVGSDRKCSIYDALLYFGTIDQEMYDELEHINETMGPVQDVTWNVAKMSSFNLKYAAYDVRYLLDFYLDILRKATRETPELYKSYQFIPLITRFIFLEKWGISELLSRIKAQVDPINNYIIKRAEGNQTLITIYNTVIKDMEIVSDRTVTLRVNNLLDINYFRSSLTLMFKMIVYTILTNEYEVYRNRDEVFDEKLSLTDTFDTLKSIHLDKLRTLVKRVYTESERRIGEVLRA